MKRPRLIRGPIRPDRWTPLRFASLRWAALPIIDRRWTAPLSALALGFGIFVGVAIGPAAEGSLGSESETQTVVEVVPAPVVPVPAATGDSPNGGQGDNKPGSTPATPTPTPTPPSDNGPFGESPPVTPSAPPITPPPTTPPTTPPSGGSSASSGDSGNDGGDQPQGPPTIKGAVVHVNEPAGSYTVARDDGTLVAIHAGELPTIGAVVQVEARALANGTRGEKGERDRTDRTQQVDLSGTVTFSDPKAGAYTLSATGVSILIRVPANTRMPIAGDQVNITARIADNLEPIEAVEPGRDGCGSPPNQSKPPRVALEQQSLEISGSAASTNLEGIVEGVCRQAGTLILSADDVRASGHDIAISIPSDLRLSEISAGQVLAIRASLGGSGHLTATRIADDEGEAAADDADRIQP